MNLLEKVGHFISKRGDYIQEQISGKRVFSAHVTNATDEVLELSGKPIVSYGRCNHFSRLMPGEAGNLSFEHDGEHGGAFEFSLGKERLFLGQYMRASYSSLFGSDQFVMEFSNKTLKQFYMNMPQNFMGLPNRGESRTESQEHAAIVRKATCSTTNQVEILLVASKDLHIFQDLDPLDSLQHLALAELCSPELLSSAVFLEEFAALRDSLEHSKSYEQVYACDLLVDSMVATGLCGKASQDACSAWRNSKAKFPAATFKLAPYRYFQQLPSELLEVHLNVCHGLLRSTALRCGETLEPMVQELKAQGQWPPALELQSEKAVVAEGEIGFASNDAIMATHLQNDDDPQKATSRASVCAGESAETADRFLQNLVRLCVNTSCTALLRRQRLLEKLDAGHGKLQAYMRHVPLSRRSGLLKQGLKPEGQKFEVYCAEIFHTLEEQTSATALLESLGESSGEYKSLSTNSKSGEFFFLSHDRKFLIKTVSEAEGRLLFRMLPEYQDHIHSLPASLIVRFAGLYHVEVGSGSWKYFLVMKSVFDPSCEIHAHYDLKGSLYHRKKKEGESCGKDEDWINAKLLVQVPEPRRRQMLEAHEADVSFLKGHHVMDYSVLVGIHYPERSQSTASKHAGIVAAGGKEVYFLGLIDFLIHFGFRKQAEHLLRAAQGHGADTSCVDPADYAARQARFLRSSIFSPADPDMGTAGILKVQVISAKNLRNADIIGASDPYVVVTVGLQSAQTHVIEDNLNPTWNCTLSLPLNNSHFGQDVEFSVWDKDFVRTTQGSDDFLGRLRLPMAKLLQKRAAELNQRLEDTSKGELHVKAWLEHETQGGYPSTPSAVWEFEVKAGFESFDPSSQKVLEDLYQASLAGGAPSVKIRSGSVEVWVDFRAMTQQVVGGTRTRPIRRRAIRQS